MVIIRERDKANFPFYRPTSEIDDVLRSAMDDQSVDRKNKEEMEMALRQWSRMQRNRLMN
jgi:hypothetical protein